MNVAQLNMARLRFPIDSPELKDFVEALEEINGLGEASPGFVWRLQDDGDATRIPHPFGEGLIINLTVWESVEALRGFTYRSPHLDFMRRRREWFNHDGIAAHLVLWWVPVGHEPTVDEAAERLAHLEKHGSTEHAFTLRQPYPAA